MLTSPGGITLGFTAGQMVQEFLYDDDVDENFRSQIVAITGEELVDEDYRDTADGAVIWWRSDDADAEDLADVLVDAQANLDDGGLIWVLSPKPSQPGHVPPADIDQAAKTAGMNATSVAAIGKVWSGIRLSSRARGK